MAQNNEATFFDVISAGFGDVVGIFTGAPLSGAPLQEEIDAVTMQLNAANKAGDTTLAEELVQEIAALKARAAQMPNPVVGRIETIENVDTAIDRLNAPFKAVGNYVSDNTGKALLTGVGLLLLYGYVRGGRG